MNVNQLLMLVRKRIADHLALADHENLTTNHAQETYATQGH